MHHTERGFIAHIERFLTLEKKMISTPFFSGNRCCEYTTGEGKYVPSKRSQLFATLSSISLSICVLCEWWKTGYSVQTVQHAKKSWGRERERACVAKAYAWRHVSLCTLIVHFQKKILYKIFILLTWELSAKHILRFKKNTLNSCEAHLQAKNKCWPKKIYI